MPIRVGIIGGTGVYDWPGATTVTTETPYGDVEVQAARQDGRRLFFVARHGAGHARAAHRVNHHANVSALAAARCDYVLGINNCGSLHKQLKPGAWTVFEDFTDHHRRGPFTFHDDDAFHVPFDPPYCPTASARLAKAFDAPRVTYAGVDGPRFETRTEAGILQHAGADVVGMTGVPEAILARERGMCYAALGFVGNYAAGVGRSSSASAIQALLAGRAGHLRSGLLRVVRALPEKKDCDCASALVKAALRKTVRGSR